MNLPKTNDARASSARKRQATRDIVRIGQRWRRRARRKADRHEIVLMQIHRGDRSVDAWVDGGTGRTLIRVPFHVLRARYLLLDDENRDPGKEGGR